MANNPGIKVSSFYKRPVAGSGQERMHIKAPIIPDADSGEEEIDNGDEEFEIDSSWEESESETDEESAVDKTEDDKKEPSKHGANINTRWRKRDPPEFDTTFIGEPFPAPPSEDIAPIDYFKIFFDDPLFQHIADQTNLYSVQQTGDSIKTTKQEIEQYVGILMMMSIIQLPQVRMYWATETRVSSIADIMSVNRFERLRRFLHFNDNTMHVPVNEKNHDKLFKVRPLIQKLLENCRKVPQEEKQCIDEQILPTKSRTFLKQYCPKKPNKWGIKVWARCGVSGLVYDFEVYTGKSTEKEEQPELLMGGNVVRRLCNTLPSNVNHKMYFDNYFSSLNLLRYLTKEKIWVVATIRQDRLKGGGRYLKSQKELQKEGRGSSDWVVEANSGIVVVRWLDNSAVQLISNYMSNVDGPDAKRWSKKEKRYIQIKRPLIVHEYNIHMGGVDLCDMLLALYRICQRSVKYYMHIFYYCLGVSVANGWLLYRRQSEQKEINKKHQLTLLKFKAQVANSLLQSGKSMVIKRGRPSLQEDNFKSKRGRHPSIPTPSADMRKDKIGHFPCFADKQQRCHHCKTGYASIQCSKCKVHLCLVKKRNCFTDFHEH